MTDQKDKEQDRDIASIHEDDQGQELQQRSRTLTEKGLQYQIELKAKTRHKAWKQLQAKTNHINSMFIEVVTRQERQLLYSHWMTLYEQFMDSDEEYIHLLSAEMTKEDRSSWFDEQYEQFEHFKGKIQSWISNSGSATSVKQEDVKSHHSGSQRSGSSRTPSMRSTLSSARLKEEQKRAELLVKASALEQKRKLEQAKLELKLKEEQLEIEYQIAIANAKTKVVDDFESSMFPQQQIIKAEIHEHLKPQSKLLDPNAASFKPSTQVKTNTASYNFGPSKLQNTTQQDNFGAHDIHTGDNNKNEAAILSVVRHLSKPACEIKKFSGDPLEYTKFMRQFQSKVVNNCEDDDERLSFLEQYTTGEANRIVSGLGYLQANIGYKAALDELKERYGDPEIVVNAYIKKALNWPIIKGTNSKALDEYSIFLQECLNAGHSMHVMKILEYSENMKQLVAKLPYHLHDRWRNQVRHLKEQGQYILFSHLVEFVKRESKKLNDPIYGREALGYDHTNSPSKTHKIIPKRTKASFATQVSDATKSKNQYIQKTQENTKPAVTKTAFTEPCLFCNEQHTLESCRRISELPFRDRIEFLRGKGLCYGCLKLGKHTRKDCTNKSTCLHCERRHPTILHIINQSSEVKPTDDSASKPDIKPTSTNSDSITSMSTVEQLPCLMGAGDTECTLAVIPVKVRKKNSLKVLHTYAFLDPGSSISFCSNSVMQHLGVSGKGTTITLDTMGSSCKMFTYLIKGLEISSLDGANYFDLPTMYTKDEMPVSIQHIPTQNDISQWSHLSDVFLPRINSSIGLLIGNNVPNAYTPLEVRTGPVDTPHATKSCLGWIPWNILRQKGCENNQSYPVNRTELIAVSKVEEDRRLNQLLRDAINSDFPEGIINEKKEPSQEDRLFLNKVHSSRKVVDGHYEYCLPFRHGDIHLPDNKQQAVHRLKSLHRKMLNHSTFHQQYTAFMDQLLVKGYAEKVPEEELMRNDGRVWYLPHHGVFHPRKPGKIRIVFDCSALYEGISLNNILLQGPNLTNDLVGVLLKFRQNSVVIIGDIESMFHQVKVSPQDCDCLRFLWWPNGHLSEKPETYRMLVHLFGATSSPCCANLALRQTAKDYGDDYDPVIKDAVLNNFYVDDFLKSTATDEEAIQIMSGISELLNKGGFHIHKWMSNSKKVLASVSIDDRAKNLKDVNLEYDQLPGDRALGVFWSAEHDYLGFRTDVKPVVATRRNMLSVIGSIFDPLGIAAPFILPAKLMLQNLCYYQDPKRHRYEAP